MAIQELLDSGISEVYIPAPKKHYCISKTLKIHSNQTLRLGETTLIKLLPFSSCRMITNAEKEAHDISIIGGIWDYDNVNQEGNPIRLKTEWFHSLTHCNGDPSHVVTYELLGEMGVPTSFSHVTRFRAMNLTIKNPTTFSFRLAYVWVDGDLDIDQVTIDNLYRNEEISHVETLKVCKGAKIKNLSLSNVLHQNSTDTPNTLFLNEGEIDKLYMYNVDPSNDKLIENEGIICKIIEK